MFYENYVRFCNSIGKTPSAVALELGIQKSTVTRWSQGSEPRDSTLLKVADYFGISVSELQNGQQKEPAPTNGDGLTERQREAVEIIKRMSDEQLKAFIAAGNSML